MLDSCWNICIRFVLTSLIAGAVDCKAADAPVLPMPVSRTSHLAPGLHDRFRVALRANVAVELTVQQLTAVLQLRAASDGDTLPVMQNDAGRQARVTLTLLAEKSTTWQIDIATQDAKRDAQYLLVVGKPHPVRATDRDRARAQRVLAEAEAQRRAAGSLEHGAQNAAATPAEILGKYQQASDSARQANDGCLELMADASRARYEFALGRYAEARESAQRALNFHCGDASDLSSAAEEAVAQRTAGAALGYLGDFVRSTAAAERALALYRKTGDPNFQAMVLANLSANYRTMGATQRALDAAQSALALAESIGDNKRAMFCRESIAAIHLQRGEWGAALESYRQTLDALRTTPYALIEGMSWNDLGLLYREIGEEADAQDAFRKAETAWTQAGNQGGLAETWLNEGELALSDGRIAQAEAVFRQSLDFDTSNGLKRERSHALNGLGRCAAARGNWDEAHTLLTEARDIAHEIGAIALETSAHQALGDMESGRHRESEASASYLNAYTLAQRADDLGGQIAALGSRARIALNSQDTVAARGLIKSAIDLIENERAQIHEPELRTAYFASQRAYYDLHVATLMRMESQQPGKGSAEAALKISEQARARALREKLAERSIAFAADPATITAERVAEDALREAAWRATQLPSDADAAARSQARGDVDEASRRLDAARGRARSADPRYAELTHPAPLDLAAIQRDLGADDAGVLEYWLGDSASYLWFVTGSGIQSFTLPARAALDESADALLALLLAPSAIVSNVSFETRTASDAEHAAAAIQQARSLGDTLLAPALATAHPHTLVVVGDGELQRIPFVLFDLDSRRDFVYLPSLATLRSLRTLPRSKGSTDSIAIVADPVFRSDDPRLHEHVDAKSAPSVNASLSAAATETGVAELPRLRHARTEATSIAAMASAADAWTVLDFAANRSAVLSADWSRYRTVHFSTHSMLNLRHPELSGIVLSLYDAQGRAEDGFLRMTDVYKLRMPVDLAVLSVCDSSRETGRGAEGIFGLSRAFFYAGAHRVLLSLWPTDDTASAEFMTRFYRHLFVDRQSAQSALRAAQTELQAQPRWNQPYYWSGFVIQGDWR